VVDLTGKAVRRKPFGHRISIQECFVDSFGRRAKYAVKSDGICLHDARLFRLLRFRPGPFGDFSPLDNKTNERIEKGRRSQYRDFN
jgi:hypothetical protein